MRIEAENPDQYIAQAPEGYREALAKLRQLLRENLPEGFEESMAYGMVGYVVPLRLFPRGYHCLPGQALPWVSIAAQKNHLAVYHMGLYADKELLDWFVAEYPKHSARKLDMGKSCLRFKKPEHVPWELLAELFRKRRPEQWVDLYSATLERKP